MSTTAIAALASATIIRPDAPTLSPALDAAIRSACAGAWSVLEIVFAGEALRARLADADDPQLVTRTSALLAIFGDHVPPRRDGLRELRVARRDGALDAKLDLTALVASCGRAGDAPAVSAGRRRVRTLAIEALPRTLASYRALSAALRESAINTFLIDAARAIYRNAARGDRDLCRWAVAPTGTTTREHSLTASAELVGSAASRSALDRLIALELGEQEPPITGVDLATTEAGPVAVDPESSPSSTPVSAPGIDVAPSVADASPASGEALPATRVSVLAAEPVSVEADPSPVAAQLERGDRVSPPQEVVPPVANHRPTIASQQQPVGDSEAVAISVPAATDRAPRESSAEVTQAIGSTRSPASFAPSTSSWVTPGLVVLAFAVAALIYFIR